MTLAGCSSFAVYSTSLDYIRTAAEHHTASKYTTAIAMAHTRQQHSIPYIIMWRRCGIKFYEVEEHHIATMRTTTQPATYATYTTLGVRCTTIIQQTHVGNPNNVVGVEVVIGVASSRRRRRFDCLLTITSSSCLCLLHGV